MDKDAIFHPPKEVPIIGISQSYIYACGKNHNYELAIEGHKEVSLPSGVALPKKDIVTFLSSGREHSAFITKQGRLYLFGSTLHGKLGIKNLQGTNVKFPTIFNLSIKNPVSQVSCGDYHTLCLFENGDLYGWGGTLYQKIGNIEPNLIVGGGLDKLIISKIGCGDFHSVALSSKINRQWNFIFMGRRRTI